MIHWQVGRPWQDPASTENPPDTSLGGFPPDAAESGKQVAMGFTQEQADRICAALIEEQLTLREIAEREQISKGLILKNVAKDEAFRDQYARAMDIRTDADFEGLDDDVEEKPERLEDGRIDPGWVQLQRVKIDTKKWKLSKRNPKKYSEKIQSEVSGPDGGAIPVSINIDL